MGELFSAITERDPDDTIWQILVDFRLPRALTAGITGAGLGISGLMMQTLFRNPLAGPFVLGISSGASLGVALLILSTSGFGSYFFSLANSGWSTIIAASAGASLVLFGVLIISKKMQNTVSLLIVGIMIGSLTGAVVSALQYFSDADQIQQYLLWTFGSLGKVTWSDMQYFGPIVLISLMLTLFLPKMLNTFLLGDEYASSMGIDLKRSRTILVIITSLLAGSITAFCGPIAFIGLASPHIARMIIKNGDHKYLIPGSILTGIVIMLLCDIISQIPGSMYVLPINVVTSLFGAPLVIWLIFRNKGLKNAF